MSNFGQTLRDETGHGIISRSKSQEESPEPCLADAVLPSLPSTSSTPGVLPNLGSQPISSLNVSGNIFHAQNVAITSSVDGIFNHSLDPLGHVPKPTGQQSRLKDCPPPIETFTGRQDVLGQMRDFFFDRSRKRHVFVLHGLGGAGKTQIALKFVEICQDTIVPRFSDVYFIDATTAETIQTDFRTIALAKGISEEDTRDWFARQKEEWLLLFNNADDTSFNLRNYFPRCSHGNILITTRNHDAVRHASDVRSSFQVSGMNLNDATTLLLKISGIQEPHTKETEGLAGKVVKELGNFVLAVVQAGAYIFHSKCGLNRYLEMHRKRRDTLLGKYSHIVQKMDDYEWMVHTTWEISFKRLSEQSATFLHLCAFLHYDGISEAIFRNAASKITDYVPRLPITAQEKDAMGKVKDFLGTFRTSDSSWDSLKFLEMITEIRSYSLIDSGSTKETQTYSIHPLVHSWTRTAVSNNDTTRMGAEWILGLSISWELTSEAYTFRSSLQSHVDTIFKGGNNVAPEFAGEFGLVYFQGGRLTDAEGLQVQAKEAFVRLLGTEHSQTLRIMGCLASTYLRQRRWKEAEELFVQAKEVCARLWGEEHAHTLMIMRHLALTYLNQGRRKEAEELLVQVKEAYLKLFGAEQSDTLRIKGDLALMYLMERRWKDAEELQVQVMEVHLKLLGAEDPNTLRSMENLASTYLSQGRRKEAEELRVQVKEAYLKLFGVEHPDTLRSMENLASTYLCQGRWKKAEELRVQVKEARLRLFGALHSETLKVMEDLVSMYLTEGRWKDAEGLQVQVKEARIRLLGVEHPQSLKSMEDLASTYLSQGRRKEALELQAQVKEARLRPLGVKHLDPLASMRRLT